MYRSTQKRKQILMGEGVRRGNQNNPERKYDALPKCIFLLGSPPSRLPRTTSTSTLEHFTENAGKNSAENFVKKLTPEIRAKILPDIAWRGFLFHEAFPNPSLAPLHPSNFGIKTTLKTPGNNIFANHLGKTRP